MSNKIFVSIAAFEDKALTKTMQRLLDSADNPENISFGLALNYKTYPDLSNFKNDIRIVYDRDFDFPGIVRMRDEIRKLIRDEEYFLGLDAHTVPAVSWDTNLIRDIKELTSNGEKIIISSQINMPWSDFSCRTEWRMGGSWHNGWGLDGVGVEEEKDIFAKNIKYLKLEYY